ncbi:MAG: glycosyltransferase family 1 protein [Prevotella sp.]|nr:glycosyltransferase family 1 protein [Prevotella sp.]
MKILLLGEYSNVHWTLAEGLRKLGHQVTVLSNGDFWKDYPRDINLVRTPGKWGGIRYMARLYSLLPRLRGYDVVQLINPMFLEIKAERIFPIYRYLRRHNGKMVMGGFGMDYYWVSTCCNEKPLRYSDFNIGDKLRTDEDALRERRDWLGTKKEELNRFIAEDCDAIVTGLYEYQVCYQPHFPEKTTFIPYPIKLEEKSLSPAPSPVGRGDSSNEDSQAASKSHSTLHIPHSTTSPYGGDKRGALSLFIGINRTRSVYKGTDIMLRAAQAIKAQYPDRVDLQIAESVPFAQYQQMLDGADAILDQLYSYTPSMNPLMAMSKGIICIGGGEPENYEILGEHELRPIINVQPTYESVYHELEQLVLHPERIPELKRQSIEYIRRHHEYLKVARQYEEVYNKR